MINTALAAAHAPTRTAIKVITWPFDISPNPQKRKIAQPTTIRISGCETELESARDICKRDWPMASLVALAAASACVCALVEG